MMLLSGVSVMNMFCALDVEYENTWALFQVLSHSCQLVLDEIA